MNADTDDAGDDSISYEEFSSWMMDTILNRDPGKAFRLSDHPRTGKMPLKHFKRAAKELGERMAAAEPGHSDDESAWTAEDPTGNATGLPPDLKRAGRGKRSGGNDGDDDSIGITTSISKSRATWQGVVEQQARGGAQLSPQQQGPRR